MPGTETYGPGGFFIHGGSHIGSAGCIHVTGDGMETFLADLKQALGGAGMLGAARREISMRRAASVVGWLAVALYFGVLLAFNVSIAGELLRLPSGFDPGWWPLIKADALYGGGGLLVVVLARLAWRRWHSRGSVAHPLPF